MVQGHTHCQRRWHGSGTHTLCQKRWHGSGTHALPEEVACLRDTHTVPEEVAWLRDTRTARGGGMSQGHTLPEEVAWLRDTHNTRTARGGGMAQGHTLPEEVAWLRDTHTASACVLDWELLPVVCFSVNQTLFKSHHTSRKVITPCSISKHTYMYMYSTCYGFSQRKRNTIPIAVHRSTHTHTCTHT